MSFYVVVMRRLSLFDFCRAVDFIYIDLIFAAYGQIAIFSVLCSDRAILLAIAIMDISS